MCAHTHTPATFHVGAGTSNNNENDPKMHTVNFISFLICTFLAVLPTRDIEIIGIKPFYQVGEMLQANCTCYSSIPSALLEWKINSFPVSTSFFYIYTYTFLLVSFSATSSNIHNHWRHRRRRRSYTVQYSARIPNLRTNLS